MIKNIILRLAVLTLFGCGTMGGAASGDPYDEDEPDYPITLKLFVDPSQLNCSVIKPCNINIGVKPSDGRPVIPVTSITTQNVAAIIETQLPDNNYLLTVNGLAANYHPVFADGNQIDGYSGANIALQLAFESGIEYQQ